MTFFEGMVGYEGAFNEEKHCQFKDSASAFLKAFGLEKDLIIKGAGGSKMLGNVFAWVFLMKHMK